ncbi:hypothetical protein [Pectobacterium brasiliense]|uniref:hypothetical protein n=1 Tax=Pectobacterium brasiliense TaxID=180957 RepID=UPI001F0830CE|nr:hypothetical protein [Pectobacterium brasiliense]
MIKKDINDVYNIKIVSLYWDNIDIRLVDSQRKVFEKFGFHIEQQNIHNMDHGVWMTDILDNTPENDVVIIVDIDCIPLNEMQSKKLLSVHVMVIYMAVLNQQIISTIIIFMQLLCFLH